MQDLMPKQVVAGVTRDQLSQTCTKQPTYWQRPSALGDLIEQPGSHLRISASSCGLLPPAALLEGCLHSTLTLNTETYFRDGFQGKPTHSQHFQFCFTPLLEYNCFWCVSFCSFCGSLWCCHQEGCVAHHVSPTLLVPPTSFPSFSLFDGTKQLFPLSSARHTGSPRTSASAWPR